MIRLGILGAGNIAHRFMKGVQGAETFSVVSVYARKADKDVYKRQDLCHEF